MKNSFKYNTDVFRIIIKGMRNQLLCLFFFPNSKSSTEQWINRYTSPKYLIITQMQLLKVVA